MTQIKYVFRVVVPEMLRKEVIESLHAAHQMRGGGPDLEIVLGLTPILTFNPKSFCEYA